MKNKILRHVLALTGSITVGVGLFFFVLPVALQTGWAVDGVRTFRETTK